MFRAMVRDDRGRVVPLVPHDVRAAIGADRERSKRLDLASLRPRPKLTPSDVRRAWAFGSLALAFLILATLGYVWLAFNPAAAASLGIPRWTRFTLVPLMGILPATATIFVGRRVAGSWVARMYANAGYCGSCGHDLLATPADHDALATCPECAAAWRLPLPRPAQP